MVDFLNYSDKLTGTTNFPAAPGATSLAPKTLYNAHDDVVYVNTGSGWTPMIQPGSRSVFPAYSTATLASQAAMITSASTIGSAPGPVHTAVATKTAEIAVKGK